MAGRIRQEDIAAVRERSPIAEVVGDYLQLRPAGGGSFKGLCPFHDEKTPSFNVAPSKGLYFCFSCNNGGDVIKFVQELESLTFAEAIERLAARAGVELRYEQGGYVPGQETGLRRRLAEAHQMAAEFYAEKLRAPGQGSSSRGRADQGSGAEGARAFLAERGFELADAERFGIGYSPRSWDDLTRHLRGRGFTDDELTKAGLARRSVRGSLIDMFRDRLMWPIRDLTGETIAFGARKLDAADEGPKYLNTPETPLFKKGHVLYGADLAKREIARQRQAVIVEGYTDVMACQLAGVPTAVATCGTSFGEDHVKVLRRLIMDTEGSDGQVIFTFDGDAAGQKAALRAFALEDKFAANTYVAIQPDGLDPCDLRIKQGDAAVRELIARRKWLFEFVIRSVLARHDLDNTAGQLAALDEAAPILAQVRDKARRERFAVDLDRWLGVMDEGFVLQRVRHLVRGGRTSTLSPGRSANQKAAAGADRQRAAASARDKRPYDRSDPVLRVEREALKLAVQVPALAGPEFDALGEEAFTVPVHAATVALIARCGGVVSAGRPRDWADRVIDSAPDDGARSFLRELAVEELAVAGDADEKYAGVILARVGELTLTRQIAVLKARLQRMNPTEEQAAYGRLFGELTMLEQRRRALVDRATGG